MLGNRSLGLRFGDVEVRAREFWLAEAMPIHWPVVPALRCPRGGLVRFDPQSKQLQPLLGGVAAEVIDFSKGGTQIAYAPTPTASCGVRRRTEQSVCSSQGMVTRTQVCMRKHGK